jgi:putative endonuclease
MKKAKRNYYKGILAEYLAIIFLFLKGYKILKRRYKNKLGEIDIIVKKKKVIIFIEVKSRKKQADFLDAITTTQERRIIRSSEIYLQRFRDEKQIRYDIIFIQFPLKINHMQNCFYTDY